MPIMRKSLIVLFLALLFSVFVAVICMGDINRAALTNFTGQKLSGSFAGINIGDGQELARNKLFKKEMVIVKYVDDGSCPINSAFDKILVFVDVSWRKGTICIGISQGRVKAIAWRYNFMQP